jgi:hypothetical protein
VAQPAPCENRDERKSRSESLAEEAVQRRSSRVPTLRAPARDESSRIALILDAAATTLTTNVQAGRMSYSLRVLRALGLRPHGDARTGSRALAGGTQQGGMRCLSQRDYAREGSGARCSWGCWQHWRWRLPRVQASSNGSARARCTGSMRQSVGKPGAPDARLGEPLESDTLRAAFAPHLLALATRPP